MYLVLECHGGPEYAIVCKDENGSNVVFDSETEAQVYSETECQDGLVVEFF